ncbi:hypothetical protein GEV33_012887 [Tenebrio molitor]|uniref:Integrase catalytic domain-containing protein n=1 Tax=Tenebrio molitor TaxID=7067 RepID=A0A8J6L345_TENMO|nr:hypothetical protein GEV33_012887 [Tenebrio molitor]
MLPIVAEQPSDLVTVDYHGPLPESRSRVSYIFAVIDSFSKFVKLYPLRRAQAKISAQRVRDFHRTVPTKVVLSDHRTQFQSKQWQETLEQWDIQPTFSTVRHPQSNPTQRVMRELRQLFRTYCQDAHANWTTVLSKIELLFNVTPHISTGYSSYEILLGKNSTNRLSKLRGPLLPAEGMTPHDTTSILDVNRDERRRQQLSPIELTTHWKVSSPFRYASLYYDTWGASMKPQF